jgi:hypothetical protein
MLLVLIIAISLLRSPLVDSPLDSTPAPPPAEDLFMSSGGPLSQEDGWFDWLFELFAVGEREDLDNELLDKRRVSTESAGLPGVVAESETRDPDSWSGSGQYGGDEDTIEGDYDGLG